MNSEQAADSITPPAFVSVAPIAAASARPPAFPPLPSSLAADPGLLDAPESEPPAASPLPRASAPPEVPAEVKEQEIIITLEGRRYRIRGMSKNLGFDALKVNILASCGELMHVDTLDLYAHRSRKQFAADAARELRLEETLLRHDLGKVLLKLEELQEKQIAEATKPKEKTVKITDAQRDAALELLKSPDLLDRILADFERCGVVGEATNKLTGYLAATSRKLEQPLAVVLQSSSAAGKSSLMEAVLAMLPPEEVTKFSAMTGQSLFYMQGSDLRHKVLAIVEEEGAERASYALKLLQSEGELTIASTGKDPQTGRLVTQEYRVEGPVMIFLTTTAAEIDEELLNRCLVLSVSEEREQTRAIHIMQRAAPDACGPTGTAPARGGARGAPGRAAAFVSGAGGQSLRGPADVPGQPHAQPAGPCEIPDAHSHGRALAPAPAGAQDGGASAGVGAVRGIHRGHAGGHCHRQSADA